METRKLGPGGAETAGVLTGATDEVKTRILFVDDEPEVLRVMEATVQTLTGEWEAEFVESGEQALIRMADKPFDVVITDMRMPGMSGAQLLNEVMRRYPRTVRIVLSGYSDLEIVLKCVGAVHQYLHKPFSPAALRATLMRLKGLNASLKNLDLRTLVARLSAPPSVPLLYLEILETLQSPEATVQRIADIVAQDPALAAKTLNLVNSAFFGFSRSVDRIGEAVQLLGVGVIRSLALAVPLFRAFEAGKCAGFSIDQLWAHSVQAGVLARRIALEETRDENEAEQAFSAGLLHDIGKLMLADGIPEIYAKIIQLTRQGPHPKNYYENEMFHATHAHVGAYLLGLWSLPTPLVEAVAYHHTPTQGNQAGFSSLTAVHVANALLHERGSPSTQEGNPQLDPAYLENLGLLKRLPYWRTIPRG